MKVVIMCAGSGERWGNYLGVPKQLIEIRGEKLLHRTIRLLRKHGVKDVIVTVPKIGYFGKLNAKQTRGIAECEVDKFLNAKKHSGAIFLWGDCYFTEDAIKTIINTKEDLMFFGRAGDSSVTGKKCGEMFAVKTNKEFFKKAEELKKHKDEMRRCASWELYTYVTENKIPYKKFTKYLPNGIDKLFVKIDDATDDFDYPRDYDRWIKNCIETKSVSDNFKINYNIMAHPKRKEYIPYLKEKLGNVKVIWDEKNDIWDTRKRCLEHHLQSGAVFGITLQDDAIVCDNFKEKAREFIKKFKEVCCYNFYFKYGFKVEELADGVDNGFIKKNDLYNEIAFAIPIDAIEGLIKYCDSLDKITSDNPLREYLKQSGYYTYFSIPSLVDHRDIVSIHRGKKREKDDIERRAWWFIENQNPLEDNPQFAWRDINNKWKRVIVGYGKK